MCIYRLKGLVVGSVMLNLFTVSEFTCNASVIFTGCLLTQTIENNQSSHSGLEINKSWLLTIMVFQLFA